MIITKEQREIARKRCEQDGNWDVIHLIDDIATLEAKVKFQAEMLEKAKEIMTLPLEGEEYDWLADLERGEK